MSERGQGCPRREPRPCNFRPTPLLNRDVRRVASIALLPAVLAAAAASAQAPVYPLAVKAKVTDCHRGPQLADRYAVFVGQMPALQGTQRMWMRFDLYERPHNSGSWLRVVDVPTFGVWEKSKPGKPGFIYTKRVDQLQAPASYRATVRFRWYDAHGKLQRAAVRTSPTCRQPDPRPDLTVGKVTAAKATAGRLRYAIRVRNDGRSDAAAFDTVLTVAGAAQPAVSVAGLPAGGATTVTVLAPACAPGSTIRIALDPADVIDEIHEGNNVAIRPCPAL
jgi:hypothetical protein